MKTPQHIRPMQMPLRIAALSLELADNPANGGSIAEAHIEEAQHSSLAASIPRPRWEIAQR